MIDCIDFVITHKPYPIEQDDLYKKLCVGDYYDDISRSEHEGKNITQYNNRLNELTGLYWMWKNDRHEYVGLSHYRRFFGRDGHRIGADVIEDILVKDGFDIILSDYLQLPLPVNLNIRMAVGNDLYMEAFGNILRAMAHHQPEYENAFISVLNGDRMYHKNMFVCRREIMERFCEWLFSFMLEATDNVDVSGRSDHEKRVCGFFGEIMWTVWLWKNALKICEMPIIRR